MYSRTAFTLTIGPCAIESYEQFRSVALLAKKLGLSTLRGGVFKARTQSDSFQGMGATALPIIREVKRETGLALISEVTDPRQIGLLGEVVDVFQVGARNMYNYELLKELGHQPRPVLLKRGLSAYLDELLAAAEYIVNGGNTQVVLCERGIRTFERATRNTLDLASVPYLQKKTGFPVIVDPSHGTGSRSLVSPMALAAAACGADGVLIEVHPNPEMALSDGPQALTPADIETLVPRLRKVLSALDRTMAGPVSQTEHSRLEEGHA